MTARQWRFLNQDKKGNLRDYVTTQQLVCLANLEAINALLIAEQASQKERLLKLNQVAIKQMKSLLGLKKLKRLPHHLPTHRRS